MNPQRRLIDGSTVSISALNDPDGAALTLEFDEADAVNVHGLHWCLSIEPENADANANGFAIIYCFPAGIIDESNSNLPASFNDLDSKLFNPYVWGITCWTASNQAPYHYEFAPRTSRTCQRGARIVSAVVLTGVSAGAVRINQIITGFTTS